MAPDSSMMTGSYWSTNCFSCRALRRSCSSSIRSTAALASDGVAGPQRRRDAGTDRDQQLVADVVAQRVIDGFEIVEVQEENRDPPLGRPVQGVVEADAEGRPVRQVGERVVERLMGELFFQRFALTDVPSIQDETADRGQLEQVGYRDFGRAVGVVHAPQPALDRDRRSFDIDGLVDLADYLRTVIGMYQVSEGLAHQLGLLVAEDALHRSALILDGALTVDEGDDV